VETQYDIRIPYRTSHTRQFGGPKSIDIHWIVIQQRIGHTTEGETMSEKEHHPFLQKYFDTKKLLEKPRKELKASRDLLRAEKHLHQEQKDQLSMLLDLLRRGVEYTITEMSPNVPLLPDEYYLFHFIDEKTQKEFAFVLDKAKLETLYEKRTD